MSTEENKALMRRYYEECNAIKGNPAKVRAVVDEFFAPDFVCHAPTGDMNFEQHFSLLFSRIRCQTVTWQPKRV